MTQTVSPVRGMNDILPAHTPLWQRLEAVVRDVFRRYGYQEIRLPVLEKTELFRRSIGEATDVVEKEMYTFDDRNGDSLTLRPEFTAGVVRAGVTHGLLYNQWQRLWYAGPAFRHERPQRGRYRQFHQIGAEAFGFDGPEVDAELLLLCARVWSRLGLRRLRLEINSLGTPQSRAAYRDALRAYFEAHRDALDDDSRRRLTTNPLRILDSKNPELAALIGGAPPMADSLDDASREHFAGLRALLDAAGIDHTVNPRLVRGLDYYTRTVFEWLTDELGAQGAVCSGGRYDGLVEELGGRPTPAIGFSMGVERLVELMAGGDAPQAAAPDVYVVSDTAAATAVTCLAEALRDALPAAAVECDLTGGGMKAQMKRADRSGAQVALIIGARELKAGVAGVRALRERREQRDVAFADVPAAVGALLQD